MFKNKNEEDEEDTDNRSIRDNLKYDEEYYNNYIKQFTKLASDLGDSTNFSHEENVKQQSFDKRCEQGNQQEQKLDDHEECIANTRQNKNMIGIYNFQHSLTIRFFGGHILSYL